MESVSTTSSIQEVPSAFECLEESSLVKAIDTLVLVLASHSLDDSDKYTKLKQIKGLTQLINTFLKGGFYTDAILPQHSIETLKLGDKMRDITVKEDDKILIARLGSVILAAKPHVTMV